MIISSLKRFHGFHGFHGFMVSWFQGFHGLFMLSHSNDFKERDSPNFNKEKRVFDVDEPYEKQGG